MLFAVGLSAEIFPLSGDLNDTEVRSDGSVRFLTSADLRVGWSRTDANGAAFYIFELPDIASPETLDSAEFSFQLTHQNGDPSFNADLYGISYRDVTTVSLDDYYHGVFGGDTNPEVTALQNDILTPASSSGEHQTDVTGSANLLNFVKAQYTAGAQAGDYIVLRINADQSEIAPGGFYYNLASADATELAPSLTLQTEAESWGGFEVVDNIFVHIEGKLGWLHVGFDPWIWSYTLQRWMYIPSPALAGLWAFFPDVLPVPQVAPPQFSVPGGSYSSAQSVGITTATTGATIRYTTDGTEPTATIGTVYTGPVAIAVTTELKAIAYEDGKDDSQVVSAIYSIQGSGTSYYVDPASGSMSNPGSDVAPWSTLEAVFAANKTFNAGDVIYLRDGNHGFPVISTDNIGSVTITAEGGHSPLLERIDFNSASNWVLENVTLFPSSAPPDEPVLEHPVFPVANSFLIRVLNNSSSITIRDCEGYSIEDASGWSADDWNYKAWNGIDFIDSEFTLVEDCYFKNVNFGMRIQGSAPNTTVRGCTIENFTGDGMKMNASNCTVEYNSILNCYDTNGNHDDAVQCQGSTSNCVFRGNYIRNYTDSNQPHKGTLQALAMFSGPYQDWVIENNVIINNHYHGITISHTGSSGCKVINNTVLDQDYNQSPGPTWISITGTGHIVRNNLTTNLTGSTSGNTIDHNLEISLSDFANYFVDYPFDLRLKSGSPAIDAGSSSDAPTVDFEGNARDATPDVGAYEFSN